VATLDALYITVNGETRRCTSAEEIEDVIREIVQDELEKARK
jgi:hypothetical protein